MAEYIERARVVDVLVDMETLALYEDAIPAIKNIRRLIDGIPSADVQPVRHGRYIIDDMGDSSCSECGERYLDVTQKYCPNCGAKLDLETQYK